MVWGNLPGDNFTSSVQINDKSASKNISFLQKKVCETTFSANLSKISISLHLYIINTENYMRKLAKSTKTQRKINAVLVPPSYLNQMQKKQRKLILNYTSIVLERPIEISFSNFKQSQCLLCMAAEMLQKPKVLLYVLYLCYIKFQFDYIFDIYVICFLIYLLILLYVSVFILFDFKFA